MRSLHSCQCAQPMIRHDFGRGSFCMICHLPERLDFTRSPAVEQGSKHQEEARAPGAWVALPTKPTRAMLECIASPIFPDDRKAGIKAIYESAYRLEGELFPANFEMEQAYGQFLRLIELARKAWAPEPSGAELEAATKAIAEYKAPEPFGYMHRIVEPDGTETEMFSKSRESPWSHWLEQHRAKCIQIVVALYDRPGPAAFECSARKQGSTGGNDPAECGWPTCGCDEHASKVIAALEESGNLRGTLEPEGWQSIETAPKDGSLILVDGGHIARWDDDRHNATPRPYWQRAGFGPPRSTRDRESPPKLWRPLPTP